MEDLTATSEPGAESSQGESRLRQINRQLRAITACNQALLRATDERQFLHEICQIICDVAGYRMAWVGFAQHDQTQSVTPVASAGVVDGYLDHVQVVWANAPYGRGPVGIAIRTGEVCYIDDFATNPQTAPWREAALQRGYRCAIALPLFDEHRSAFAALIIYSSVPHAFTQQEIELLTELAADLAFGIRTLRTRAEHRRAQLELETTKRILAEGERIAHLGSWELDLFQNRLTWSDEVYRILGLQPRQFAATYEAFLDAVHPDDRQAVNSAYYQSLRDESDTYEIEHRVIHKATGEIRWVHERCEHIRNAAGRVVRSMGMVHDITERKQAEAALKDRDERIRSYFDLPLVGIAVTSPDKGWLEVNDHLCHLFGYSREQLVRMTWAELTHPDDLAADVFQFNCMLAGEIDGYSLEKRFLCADGRVLPTELGVRCVRHSDGRVKYVVALIQDITQRAEALEALRESEHRYRTLANSGQALVWTAGLDKKCNYFNQPWLAFTGRTLEQELGDGWAEGVHPDDLARCVETYVTAFDKRQRFSMEYRLRAASGEYRWIQDDGSPSFDGQGNFLGYIGHCLDIHARKALEEQLRQAQKMEAVGQLAGGVAHDFNNMLAATMMNLSLLRDEFNPDSPKQEVFRDLMHGAKRAADLTRQLLMFSRRSVLETKPLDLNEVLQHTLKMLQRLIGEHIVIQTSFPSSPAPVLADPGMLEQVLLNLAVNARDAMPSGGQLTIAIQSLELDAPHLAARPEARPGQFHCLSVTDTGCGMDKKTMQRIFEPFFTTKEIGKGTGLGLATVHGIVAQHKGWVEVESQPGRGSTFRVFLPAAASASAAGTAAAMPLLRGTETILLVEDEAALCRAAALALRRLGYTVFCAENGDAALQLWAEEKDQIDLLLTDMVMPGSLSGLQLAARLRHEKPGLKIIISSGYHPEMSQSEKVIASGITFFRKPYQIEQLSTLLRHCLHGTTPP